MRTICLLSIAVLFFSSCTKVLFIEPQSLGQSLSLVTPDYLKNRIFTSVNQEGIADTIGFSEHSILLADAKSIDLSSSKDSFQLYVNGSYGLFNYRDAGATEWEVLIMSQKANGDINVYYPWHSWNYNDIEISSDQNIHKKGQLTLEECQRIAEDSTNLVARLTKDGSYQYLFDMSSPTSSVTWEELKPSNKKAAAQLKKLIAQAKKENEAQAKIEEEQAANCQTFYDHLYKIHGGEKEQIWGVVPHLYYSDPSRGFEIQPSRTDTTLGVAENGADTMYLIQYYYELVQLRKGQKNNSYFSYAMENIIPDELASELLAKRWIYFDLSGTENSGYSNELVSFNHLQIQDKLQPHLRFTDAVEYYSPDCQDPETGMYDKKTLKKQLKQFQGRTVGSY